MVSVRRREKANCVQPSEAERAGTWMGIGGGAVTVTLVRPGESVSLNPLTTKRVLMALNKLRENLHPSRHPRLSGGDQCHHLSKCKEAAICINKTFGRAKTMQGSLCKALRLLLLIIISE